MERYASLLIEFTLGVCLLLLLVRFFLSSGRFYLPPQFTATIHQLTEWAVRPMAFLPRISKYETAALMAGLVLTMLQEIAVYYLHGVEIFQQPSVALPLVFTRSVLLVLSRVVQIYVVVIIAGLLCQWFRTRDPLSQALGYCYTQLTMPYIRLLQRTRFAALAPLLAILVAQIILLAIDDTLMRISAIFR